METTNEPSTPIDESLARLKSYFGKFSNEVAENILLRELFFVFTDIKDYIEDDTDDGDNGEIDELEERIRILENKTSSLKISISSLEDIMEQVDTDIVLLKENDQEIVSKIIDLETEDEAINNLINSVLASSSIEFGKLEGVDSHIRITIDESKPLLETELDFRREQLENLDVDKINESILNLRESDVYIKTDVTSNHQTEIKAINEIEGEVGDKDIVEDITSLKETDLTLNSSIDSIKSESDNSIVDLKAENGEQRGEFNKHEVSIEELEKDSQRGSRIAHIGKMPIGKENRFIDDDWFPFNRPPPIDEWYLLPHGLNSGSANELMNSIAVSDDIFVAGFNGGWAAISRDKGETWEPLERGLNSGSNINATINVLAVYENMFMAGFNNGYASISRDKGETWEPIERGFDGTIMIGVSIFSISISKDKIIVCFDGGYASISSDEGESWKELPRGLNSGSSSSIITSIVSTGDVFVSGHASGHAAISRDKGETWEALERYINSGGSGSDKTTLSSYGDTIITGFDGGWASISRDKGETWERLVRGLNSGVLEENILSLTTFGNICMAGLNSGYASISKDKGETWEPMERGLGLGIPNASINVLAGSEKTFVSGSNSGRASRIVYS